MMNRQVRLSAGTVHYREQGEGPTIVFIHGALMNGQLWDQVVAQLGGQFRCVVPELPFAGHRTAMDADADLTPPGCARLIAEFLDTLDLRDVTLVANDTGGAITQLVAADHPERIARLVLTPCDTYEHFFPRWFRYVQVAAHLPGGVWLLAQSLRLPPLRRSPIGYGWLAKRPIPADLLADWVRPVISERGVRRDAGKFIRGIRKRYTIEAAQRLRTFDRPTLLAFAADDKFFPPAHAERLAKDIPRAQVRVIDDSRTLAPLDRPDAVAALIREFAAMAV
jgi:pimeloyl-ACP methyl ester carboxylesterase